MLVPGPSLFPDDDDCGVAVIADRHGRAKRKIVEQSLEALRRLPHRASVHLKAPSSHAAGILTAIPWDLFGPDLPAALADPAAHRIAAMFALDPQQADRAIVAARWALRRLGWHVMAWREVPTRLDALAPHDRPKAPRVVQCFARASRHPQKRTAYRTRLAIEARWLRLGLSRCSVTSLSDSTIVYKGLMDPPALPDVFPDLADPRYASAFAVVHHQSCAHTLSRWDLAQPFHGIAHSGEIKTIAGNRLWMQVRISDTGTRDEADLVKAGGSDSQTLDAAVQWLCDTGLSTPHALTRLLPPAWEHDDRLPSEVRAFHRHEACFAEPWEGPALVAFADGRYVGAMIDRNGVRSCHTVEADDIVCVASASDVVDLPEQAITQRGRLGAGEMLVVDLARATVLLRDGASGTLAAQADYVSLADQLIHRIRETRHAEEGARETKSISLRTLLGRRGQWMSEGLPPVLLELDSPLLLDQELSAVLNQSAVRAAVLPIGFDAGGSVSREEALRHALATLQSTAAALAANGTRILVLSDRRLEPGLTPIPALQATDAVDSALRAARLRLRASLIIESGDIRDAHEAAALYGVGASAVVPYLLYTSARQITGDAQAAERCRRALEAALEIILSRTGVYSFEAYSGARLFHADPEASEESVAAASALA